MDDKLAVLKQIAKRIRMVGASTWMLSWDQEVIMPPGGAGTRAEMLGTMQGLWHELHTSDEVGELLATLEPYAQTLDEDSDDRAIIEHMAMEYKKRTQVPTSLVEEIYRTAGLAKEAWRKARAENDFAIFEPLLEKMVDLMKQKAGYLGDFENPYDGLLDDFEPGLTYEYIDGVFSDLRPKLRKLIEAIAKHQDAVNVSVIRREVPAETQMEFGRYITDQIGYDYQRGRLDLSTHPFTSGTGPGDMRITTRVDPVNPISNVMSCLHEAGHGMHGQNVDRELAMYPVGAFSTLAIAESQSRFYENVIGRSLPFWTRYYPDLQKAFAPAFDDVDLMTFYKAVNHSAPSLIRVEADEVTYGMHIMIRFEIENELINETLAVKDLPEAWNARMEKYLGVVPPTDTEGVLQDIHWSQGGFGYFPDYLLGSIYAAQLWAKMRAEMPDVDGRIEAGDFTDILAWTADNVMKHGRRYTFPELTGRTVGGFRADEYLEYLEAKYSDVYGF